MKSRGIPEEANAHLVHVRILLWIGEHVERRVQLIEHVDDFHRAAGVRVSGAVRSEADDPGEQQGHAVVLLRRNWPRVPQLVRHGNGQHRVQQSAGHEQLFTDSPPSNDFVGSLSILLAKTATASKSKLSLSFLQFSRII